MSDYLVDISNDSSNHPNYVLVRCPICEETIIDDIDECSNTHPRTVADHIRTHNAEEVGLGRYEFRPMADILIELHGLGRERKGAL